MEVNQILVYMHVKPNNSKYLRSQWEGHILTLHDFVAVTPYVLIDYA